MVVASGFRSAAIAPGIAVEDYFVNQPTRDVCKSVISNERTAGVLRDYRWLHKHCHAPGPRNWWCCRQVRCF
jgi:hypothetical protein